MLRLFPHAARMSSVTPLCFRVDGFTFRLSSPPQGFELRLAPDITRFPKCRHRLTVSALMRNAPAAG